MEVFALNSSYLYLIIVALCLTITAMYTEFYTEFSAAIDAPPIVSLVTIAVARPPGGCRLCIR